jgi:hypothetical protein
MLLTLLGGEYGIGWTLKLVTIYLTIYGGFVQNFKKKFGIFILLLFLQNDLFDQSILNFFFNHH